MTESHESEEDAEDVEIFQTVDALIRANRWTWQAVGAVLGLAGGLATILMGTLFTVVSWFSAPGDDHVYLYRLGTIPFFVTIPLLLLGAHCLDLLEKKSRTTAYLSKARSINPNSISRSNIKGRRGKYFCIVGGALFIPALLCSFQLSTFAQQTRLNVPSGDVLEKGKVYAKLAIPFRVAEHDYSSFVPRVMVDDGERVEFGPITKMFAVQTDWLTGKYPNGYFRPGFAHKLHRKLTGYFRIPLDNSNVTRGNHFLYAEIDFD